MKILQILPELNVGGVERGCVDLARELVRQNHQAVVVSGGGNLVKELESSGARHIRLPVHKKSLFSILANIPKLAKILHQEQIDIVHARSRVPALIAFLACRRRQTNFVTTCHGYYSQNFFSRVMGWGKLVIVSSAAIERHMREDFGVPQKRIRFIPRGVDLEEFRFQKKVSPEALAKGDSPPKLQRRRTKIKDERLKIFTVGVIARLTPIKGHKYFLEALARVIRLLPQVRALIIGDASSGKEKYQEELKMLIRRLSLDEYVKFLGRQDNVPQVLSRLDALVLPTVTQEAFGRVLIEAGACGVPVIATKVGGVVDIIKDELNGLLVEPKDAADLASAILRLAKEPQLRQRLALAGRKNVEENFTLKQMVEKTSKVYEEVKTTLRILVLKLSALGDVILASPSLRALRERFPHAHITVLTGQANRLILQDCPYVNQILEFAQTTRTAQDIWRTSSLLRKLYFDIVVDLQNSRKSHLLAYLSGCNNRYGYDNGKLGFLLNRKAKDTKSPLSPIKHQARTLRLLGIESIKEDLELWPKANDQIWADNFLKQNQLDKARALIGVNLGVSINWPSKRWEMEKFAALIDKFHDAGVQIVVTGKGEDRKLLLRLRELCRHAFIDAVGKTSLMQLTCLIKRCKVYITSDSAPLHIAYAMGTAVIALFGPTDPRRHALSGARGVTIKTDLPCSPCYKRQCPTQTCMKKIRVEEVFEVVNGLLQ